MLELSLTFEPENKSSLKDIIKETNDYGLLYLNNILDEDYSLAQIITNSTTTETEEIKAKIVDKVKSVHGYYEGLHARIHYN